MKTILIALGINLVYAVLFFGIYYLAGIELNTNLIRANIILWIFLVIKAVGSGLLRKTFNYTETAAVAFFGNIVIVSVLFFLSSAYIAIQNHLVSVTLEGGLKLLAYALGFLYAYVIYAVITTFFKGSLYKKIGLALTVLTFLICSVFPDLFSVFLKF